MSHCSLGLIMFGGFSASSMLKVSLHYEILKQSFQGQLSFWLLWITSFIWELCHLLVHLSSHITDECAHQHRWGACGFHWWPSTWEVGIFYLFCFLQSSDHAFMCVKSTLPLCQFKIARDLGGILVFPKYQCLSQLMVSKVTLQTLYLSPSCCL